MNTNGPDLANLFRQLSEQTSGSAEKPDALQLQALLNNTTSAQQEQTAPGGFTLQNALRQVSGLSNLDASQLSRLSDLSQSQ